MKFRARRFLLGLSSDELQFIAGYFGACILASGDGTACGDTEPAGRIVRFPSYGAARIAADRELKLILLREYLCHAGVQAVPIPISHSVH
jgi:hypothetical protein